MLFPPYHSYLLGKKCEQLHLKIREQKGVVYVAQMFPKAFPVKLIFPELKTPLIFSNGLLKWNKWLGIISSLQLTLLVMCLCSHTHVHT